MVRAVGLFWIVAQPSLWWLQSSLRFVLWTLVPWATCPMVSWVPGYKWFWGVFSWSLGYITIGVQVEGFWGYDEDQVALVIPDSTGFGSWLLVTLGTPTINQIINMIKESEMDELWVSLNGLRIASILACWQAGLSIQRETATNQAVDPTNLKEAAKTTKREKMDAFLSKIIHCWMKTLLLGNIMHVMTQSLKGVMDPTCLMAWVLWTCTLKWFLGASEFQW